MGEPDKFDAGKVADLARQIDEQEKQLVVLRCAKSKADSEVNSAECRLHNLQSALTRAVERQLDHSMLHHPAMQRG